MREWANPIRMALVRSQESEYSDMVSVLALHVASTLQQNPRPGLGLRPGSREDAQAGVVVVEGTVGVPKWKLARSSSNNSSNQMLHPGAVTIRTGELHMLVCRSKAIANASCVLLFH
jgi:hypothetical protein